ncbi:MAG: acetolactate synthase small subunit [Candidatus Omnitrophota bacterium]|nr:acetolactate synthase small subunit [Candidatus Omnitrophota bacterium]
MKHVISALVENKSGVLARVSGMFSARGFNIDSLAVGKTDDPAVSRMTIVTEGDERTLEQIIKQLYRLIDVIRVQDITEQDYIDRELILIKVNITSQNRPEIIQIVDTFKGRIVDVSPRTLTVEASGERSKIEAIIKLLSSFGLREIVRTGQIAISRKKEVTIKNNC